MLAFIHKIRKGPEHHKRRWLFVFVFSIMFVIVGLWTVMLKYELDTPEKAAISETSEKHGSPFEALKVMISNAKQTASALDGKESYKAEEEEAFVPLEVVR